MKILTENEDGSDISTQRPKDKYFFQWFAAVSATILLLSAGTASGWGSPSIPKLNHDDTPIPITPDESSWIISLMEIGVLISAIPAAWIMDKFGRKVALIVGVIPITGAWIIIGTAEIVPLLYFARILCGLTYGLCYTVVPMYLGEIASDRFRGALTIILTIMMKTGVLLAYIIGPFVSFRALPWINLIPPICFLAVIYWLPETPYHLLAKNNPTAAHGVLKKLRGHSEIDDELQMMNDAVKLSKENNGTIRELISSRGNRRALIIIMGLTAIQILCGSQAMISYSETIFMRVGSALEAYQISIIFGAVQLVAAGFSATVVDHVGRRPLLLFSVGGTTICNFLVGLFFFLDRQGVDVSQLSWLPILSMMAFIICYVLGLATVTFALLGEIFPTNLKAIAGCVYTITSSALSFAVHKLFQVVSDDIGSDVSFWLFALFGVIFLPFIWFLVPETKGEPLDSILRKLNGIKEEILPSVPSTTTITTSSSSGDGQQTTDTNGDLYVSNIIMGTEKDGENKKNNIDWRR